MGDQHPCLQIDEDKKKTGEVRHEKRVHIPWKINMEPENSGLEDDFPFQLGVVFRFHVNLPGCTLI